MQQQSEALEVFNDPYQGMGAENDGAEDTLGFGGVRLMPELAAVLVTAK